MKNLKASMDRRAFFNIALTLGIASRFVSRASAAEETLQELLRMPAVSETQRGDPDETEDQTVTILNPGRQKANLPGTFGPRKDAKGVAKRMLEIAKGEANAHVSRGNNPKKVAEYLEVLGVAPKDENGKDSRFCAAGVVYVACQAYLESKEAESYSRTETDERLGTFQHCLPTLGKHYFFPSEGVRFIKAGAVERGNWKSADTEPKPGWLVIFSWNQSDRRKDMHIGIVESANKSVLNTIEFNTASEEAGSQGNGGVVAPRVRKRDWRVLGFVALYD